MLARCATAGEGDAKFPVPPRWQELVRHAHQRLVLPWRQSLGLLPRAPLTQREIDVLRWFAEGKSVAQVATLLGLAETTVSYHARSARSKLGEKDHVAAVVKAALVGLLSE